MATRQELLSAREDLHVHIHAAEDWQESYKASPNTFVQLLRLEAALESAAGEYLLGLATRSLGYVDWSRLPDPIKADAGPVVNNDDPAWKEEQVILTAAVLSTITELITTGAEAGEYVYKIPAGYTSLDEAIMEAARNHVGGLVKGVTETTRKLIRESVATSIAMGEDLSASKARLMKIMNNPVRAEMIAATESVNAYQTGLYHYAKTTGAKKKTWDGLRGACNLCFPLIGKTIGIDELFDVGNGTKALFPAIHIRDRCGVIYIY
ncbi:hypothetical protein E3O44_12625 [Cryobacterium algoricola]|uniref:Phage head morphogenesis domain-containing protein n=1 Tax=Cryobacterium algoricola TaxID=1259183 RepID=A0ABY2IAG7_9MICO|nr:hypothetical protein [Cryobacterium algoricola]TFB85840.1 hypothetical protein E3O44_12625 [Cryobacterium algoricola]